ncbi:MULTISPECIES: TIGR02452 family protein [Brevibacillus]|uniref:TIGR02452 family protein n=1 Tax=Brevibacillus TaxID=55080 RepID=UPI00156B53E2|nr:MULTISPECIES: TIGR02452 family protein [Brevibacillus]MDR5002392.1 TIGR02452 family protein [Brevibacillus parabrevis]NRQ52970.1 TIGR02452 family protein [Brevibacillus sp. HD1.4A]
MSQGNNRGGRAKTAHETLHILEQGEYVNRRGQKVQIAAELATAVSGTLLYRPDDLTENSAAGVARTGRGSIQVTFESSLGAAERLIVREKRSDTLCLNFASAKNPGGGFLGGSQAQEESLARASGLYPCLVQMEEMYQYNRQLKTCFYSDYMIYSPDVPVIRNEADELLDEPYLLSFVTAPAVNAGVVREREPENANLIATVMKERIRKVLRLAAMHEKRTIILGAYGCGVFRNHARDVADYFAQVLLQEEYAPLFDQIVFAIYDHSARQENLRAFKERFA